MIRKLFNVRSLALAAALAFAGVSTTGCIVRTNRGHTGHHVHSSKHHHRHCHWRGKHKRTQKCHAHTHSHGGRHSHH